VNRKTLLTILGQTSALLVGLGLLATPCFAQTCFRDVPSPWESTDVGDVGTPGRACRGYDGDWFLWGAGSDIWGTEDSFHFMYQPIRDGRISAPVSSQTGTDPFAKTGVMIRQSLDPASPHVILDVKPDGRIEFMTRSSLGGETTFVAGHDRVGSWGQSLILVRSRGVVTAEVCAFGNGCEAVGSTPWLSGPALIGIAVTSHDPTRLNHPSIPVDITVHALPAPWRSGDVGMVGRRGAAFFENDTFYVTGAGSDIWGDADSFHYVWQSQVAADTEIVARVVSEDGTDPYAKAGVIIRGPYQLGAPTVILNVRPTGDVEFMARTREGDDMAFIAAGFMPAPVWLRLVRHADTFTASISADGTAWQSLGTVDVPNQRFDYVGLAVTSHDPDLLNTAIVDRVSVSR
jgi:hypothetical protein